jgi:formylglycine-generating enzyme required for sulfatase activity
MNNTLTIALPGLTDADVPFQFQRIPAGSFRMGQRGGNSNEEPVHRVEIPEPFHMGTWLVTQKQYRLMAEQCQAQLAAIERNRGTTPSQLPKEGPSDRHPVDSVSWDDANCICRWLTESGLLPVGWRASLPSEAHWEYACRAGSDGRYSFGNREQDLPKHGWFADNAKGTTHPVGQKPPNDWGLFDMHGNVQEWCLDLFDPRAYRKHIDGFTARPLEDARGVEHDPPPDWLKPLVKMLLRFAHGTTDDDLQVLDSERDALTEYQRYAEHWAIGQDNRKADVDATKKAAATGLWDSAYRPLASETLPEWEQYLESFSGDVVRVIRGGSWIISARNCRAAFRARARPHFRCGYQGFRVCLFFGSFVPSQQQLRSEQTEAEQGVKPPRRRRQ